MLIGPTVLVFCAVIVYPLISAIYLSLFSIYTPTLEGEWVGLSNYTELLAKGEFWSSLWTNIIWTVGTLTLQILFGVGMALILHQNMLFPVAGAQSHTVSLFRFNSGCGARVALALQ